MVSAAAALLLLAWLLSLPEVCLFETPYLAVIENVDAREAPVAAERAFDALVDWSKWTTWNTFWISDVHEGPAAKGAQVSVLISSSPPLRIPFLITDVDPVAKRFCWRVNVPTWQPLVNVFLRTGRCTYLAYDKDSRAVVMRSADPHFGLLAYPICLFNREEAEQGYARLAQNLKGLLASSSS